MRLLISILIFSAFTSVNLSPAHAETIMCKSLFARTNVFAYPPLLKTITPETPHTIQNLPAYLELKLGKKVLELAQLGSASFDILLGKERDQITNSAIYDIVEARPIENPFGAFNVSYVRFRTGEEKVIFTNINGESRYIQLLSFLKLAGVAERRISVKGDLTSYRSLYRETFKKIGHKPDLVVFGFANTAIQAMAEMSNKRLWKMVKEKNKFYAEEKWIKPDSHEHELMNMGIQVMRFAGGKKVWFIDNEYGDRAGQLARALREHGVKEVLLLGTAGALKSKYKVGDIVAPDAVMNEKGLIEKLKTMGLYKQKDGTHVHVDSPAVETKEWLDRSRAVADFVDVELLKVAQEIKNIPYDAYLVISDVLHSDKPSDYTQWTEQHRVQLKQNLIPILTLFLQRAGVTDLNDLRMYGIHPFIQTDKKGVVNVEE